MSPPKTFLNPLSSRQTEVMKLIVKDLSNKDIAQKLNISIATVETHRRNIFHKLNLHSPLALLRWALKNHLEKL